MNAELKTSPDALERAREILDRSDEVPSLGELAAQVGLSPSHLQRAFRRAYGVSPAEYARSKRFGEFKRALRDGASITDAIYGAGFGSGSRVYEHSDRLLGMPPARYREGAAGVAIRYTTLACPLGRVLVAATERGLCAVNIGDDDDTLLKQLRGEFPRARITRVDAGRDEWLSVVVARIAAQFGKDENATRSELPPLDITATAFQWRVWDALTRIPAGETRSYGEIATLLRSSARAVGGACGANPIPLVVPCHRIVASGGKIGGFMGARDDGFELGIKRWLLAHEGAI